MKPRPRFCEGLWYWNGTGKASKYRIYCLSFCAGRFIRFDVQLLLDLAGEEKRGSFVSISRSGFVEPASLQICNKELPMRDGCYCHSGNKPQVHEESKVVQKENQKGNTQRTATGLPQRRTETADAVIETRELSKKAEGAACFGTFVNAP